MVRSVAAGGRDQRRVQLAALEDRTPRSGGWWERVRAFFGVIGGSIIAVLVLGAWFGAAAVIAAAVAAAFLMSVSAQ